MEVVTGLASIIQADACALPLPDASVDLIVTSPPYFGLRSYTDDGEHYAGQIGAEASPTEYVDSLIACTREWIRVLKPAGSIFVNLGDSYYSGRGAPGRTSTDPKNAGRNARRAGRSALDAPGLGLPRKSLVGTPWRYALACIDDLGLTLRAELIWSKPNALPESVTDRVRRSHETWFHFTAQPTYFAAVDEIREPSNPGNLRPGDLAGRVSAKDQARRTSRHGTIGHVGKPLAFNPLGKLPGSVWEIATEPLRVPEHLGVNHFAAFPTEWPRRIILGWSPSGICTECGEGRRPVVEGERRTGPHGPQTIPYDRAGAGTRHGAGRSTLTTVGTYHITGEACACTAPTAPTRPPVVLDPFGGTGTTALVARAYGRHGISIDRSADYCRLAMWRTNDPGELAKAMRVEKPPVQMDGQASLLDALVVQP